MSQHRRHELRCNLRIEQPISVLREHGHVPHRIIDPEPHEPAEQQIIVELLHQLPLGAHREERLQQRGAQELLRRDRRPPVRGIEAGELGIERQEGVIHNLADLA